MNSESSTINGRSMLRSPPPPCAAPPRFFTRSSCAALKETTKGGNEVKAHLKALHEVFKNKSVGGN